MSRWHREHPELTGTDADPWMIHESYRKALPRILTEEVEEWEAELEQERRELADPGRIGDPDEEFEDDRLAPGWPHWMDR